MIKAYCNACSLCSVTSGKIREQAKEESKSEREEMKVEVEKRERGR